LTPDDHLLPSQRQPSLAQERAILLAGFMLLAMCLVTIPFRFVPLRRFDAFIPVVDAVLFLGDLLTATLLFAQGAVSRSRALLALASGYLFTALIIVPHGLSFPGAFAPAGLIGGGVETTIWLFLFWHLGLPIAVIVYVMQAPRDASHQLPADRVRSVLGLCVLAAVLLTVALTLLATVGQDHLFPLMADSMSWVPGRVALASSVSLLLLLVALVLVWRRPRSMLDLWLALSLWAWLIEVVLAITTTARFTAGWYVGRAAGMFSALCVLVMLLSEIGRLYARLSLAVITQQREREGRLMTLNAVAASIAHEAKQPLAAIVAEAGAGLSFLERDPPELSELMDILQSIEAQGQRAGDAVDSIRAMFANRATERHRFDANKLIHETVALMSAEFAQARVSLTFELDETAPFLFADRRQIQHVLLNLLTNSIEAMNPLDDGRPRHIIIRSACPNPTSLQITVEDSGMGFAEGQLERMFDTFFSTKSEGTGMGLSLCRSIVMSHNGRLWGVPREPRGAALHVLLPNLSDQGSK
jgi:signal transduction histidine kinase